MIEGVDHVSGAVCGGDATLNTINVELDSPPKWDSLPIGARVSLQYGIPQPDSTGSSDTLNACISYLVHGDANFEGFEQGLVEYYKNLCDSLRSQVMGDREPVKQSCESVMKSDLAYELGDAARRAWLEHGSDSWVTIGKSIVDELLCHAPLHASTDELHFECRHFETGKAYTVSLGREEVLDRMSDVIFDKLAAVLCKCEERADDCFCHEQSDYFEIVV